jgi:ATP/ADP translocase
MYLLILKAKKQSMSLSESFRYGYSVSRYIRLIALELIIDGIAIIL